MSKVRHTFENESDLLNFYTNQYYEALQEEPTLRHDDVLHERLIMLINGRYQKKLWKEEGAFGFNYESYKDKLIENLNHLTQFFSKKTEAEELRERKKQFREQTLNNK